MKTLLHSHDRHIFNLTMQIVFEEILYESLVSKINLNGFKNSLENAKAYTYPYQIFFIYKWYKNSDHRVSYGKCLWMMKVRARVEWGETKRSLSHNSEVISQQWVCWKQPWIVVSFTWMLSEWFLWTRSRESWNSSLKEKSSDFLPVPLLP